MKKQKIWIQKASGDRVPFDMAKLRSSLERSGAADKAIAEILPLVEEMLHEGITTREIYKKAYQMLKTYSKAAAGRYKLKDALLELGPSGFPFERFIAEIFKREGYRVEVGEIVQGRCVTHEVDVIARNKYERNMIECKYHSKRGVNTDVKVPLYVHARFQDIQAHIAKDLDAHEEQFQGWLVTNTRFSDDALQYGRCAGLQLLCWDYPSGAGLRERIAQTGTHPVTCLSSLSQSDKTKLVEANVILCQDLLDNPHALHQLGLSEARISKVMGEASKIAEC